MMVMNAQVKLEKKPEAQVAADFLAENLNVQVKIKKKLPALDSGGTPGII